MKKIEILFNEKNSNWSNSDDYNRMFFHNNATQLKTKFKKIGYIYTSTIYEAFGAEWNISNENLCFTKDKNEIVMYFESIGGGEYHILVEIFERRTDIGTAQN